MFDSVVVLEESPFKDQFTSPCPWITKSLKTVKESAFCKQSVMYHVKSIYSVTATMHEVTAKNGLSLRTNLQVLDLRVQVPVLEPYVRDNITVVWSL